MPFDAVATVVPHLATKCYRFLHRAPVIDPRGTGTWMLSCGVNGSLSLVSFEPLSHARQFSRPLQSMCLSRRVDEDSTKRTFTFTQPFSQHCAHSCEGLFARRN
jgi:hypothetical protein